MTLTPHRLLWKYTTDSQLNGVGAIYKGSYFNINAKGVAIALDMKTGKEIWTMKARVQPLVYRTPMYHFSPIPFALPSALALGF